MSYEYPAPKSKHIKSDTFHMCLETSFAHPYVQSLGCRYKYEDFYKWKVQKQNAIVIGQDFNAHALCCGYKDAYFVWSESEKRLYLSVKGKDLLNHDFVAFYCHACMFYGVLSIESVWYNLCEITREIRDKVTFPLLPEQTEWQLELLPELTEEDFLNPLQLTLYSFEVMEEEKSSPESHSDILSRRHGC